MNHCDVVIEQGNRQQIAGSVMEQCGRRKTKEDAVGGSAWTRGEQMGRSFLSNCTEATWGVSRNVAQVTRVRSARIHRPHPVSREESLESSWTLAALLKVAAGKVANFITSDGTVIDLFWEPELKPPDPNPQQAFTRANHLAFDIDPQLFDSAVEVLYLHKVCIDSGPVSRPTGRGIYFYDPDGFMIEIRCDP